MAAAMRFTPPFAGLLIGAAALMGFPALAQTEPGDDSELRYGVALYHYYQQNYLEALSELMLAESRGGITDQGTNPQLVEGGIRLAFGMPESAGRLFEQALDDQRTPAQREAAWFYLGKLHYLRGDWHAAGERFSQTGNHLEEDLDWER